MKRLILDVQDDLVPQVLDFLYSLPEQSIKVADDINNSSTVKLNEKPKDWLQDMFDLMDQSVANSEIEKVTFDKNAKRDWTREELHRV